MRPSGITNNAITGYLHTATLCTVDLEGYKHFYGSVMNMHIDGPIELLHEEKIKQKSFWHIPEDIDYDLYHVYRASVNSLIQLRLLHLKTKTPSIHNSYNAYELGSFSLGFPTSNARWFHKRMEDYGIKAMAPMQIGDIVRADGVPGQYIETIYQGPDYLHCVGIERVGISQLAPCDEQGFGGPGYSALVVNNAEAEIAFFTKVLGHNILLDEVWETAEGSALGTPAGVPYRFTSIWPEGAEQNYVIVLEFKDGGAINTGVPSHIPNQGLGMYTYCTHNIAEVVKRAKDNGNIVLSDVCELNDAILGHGKACILQSPSGFYFEIFQQN